MTNNQDLRIVRGFGVYHALAIVPFAVPIVSNFVWKSLGSIHNGLGLSGVWPAASATQMLFVNLFGTLAFVWSLLRIRQPTRQLGRYEGWAMLAFSAIVIYHVINGASPLWLIIPLVDLPGGLLHLYYFNK